MLTTTTSILADETETESDLALDLLQDDVIPKGGTVMIGPCNEGGQCCVKGNFGYSNGNAYYGSGGCDGVTSDNGTFGNCQSESGCSISCNYCTKMTFPGMDEFGK